MRLLQDGVCNGDASSVGVNDNSPCRWTRQLGENHNPQLIDLPRSEQVSRGRELLSLLKQAEDSAPPRASRIPPTTLQLSTALEPRGNPPTTLQLSTALEPRGNSVVPTVILAAPAGVVSAAPSSCHGLAGATQTAIVSTTAAAAAATIPAPQQGAAAGTTAAKEPEVAAVDPIASISQRLSEAWSSGTAQLPGGPASMGGSRMITFDPYDPFGLMSNGCSGCGAAQHPGAAQEYTCWVPMEYDSSACCNAAVASMQALAGRCQWSCFDDPPVDQCTKMQSHAASSLPGRDCDAHAIRIPGERTTVMLRNLPNNYTRAMLLTLVEAEGFAGKYDFVYLPIDFGSQAGLGYTFINFVTPGDALRCFAVFEGFSNWVLPSDKVCSVTWGMPHQGLQSHIERYRNSPVMHESIPDEWKPAVFCNGRRLVFPPPTKVIQAPKIRHRVEANRPFVWSS